MDTKGDISYGSYYGIMFLLEYGYVTWELLERIV